MQSPRAIWNELAEVGASTHHSCFVKLARSPRARRSFGGAVLLGTFLAGAGGSAADDELVTEIHGFGSATYGNTDGNQYLGGDDQGEYRNTRFALAVASSVSEKLRVVAQSELLSNRSELEVELDYAFAEWRFSDRARLRAGRVKQPFGIYAEVFDVGTVRPFAELPRATYFAGTVAESFDGVGLAGAVREVGRWGLRYDVYVGGVALAGEEAALGHGAEEGGAGEAEQAEEESLRDVAGARLVLETPLSGLSLGVSAFTGEEQDEVERRSVLGLHGEFLRGPWSLRAEFVHGTFGDELTSRAFYVEAARRFGARWQAAARYDWLRLDVDEDSDWADVPPALRRHADLACGLNYWFDPQFVLKLALHRVDGNRFTGPSTGSAAGAVRPRTTLLTLAAQFSF